jgi:L-asparaginase II
MASHDSGGYAPLVETTRGLDNENLHFGAIAVVDAGGRVLAACGDPLRSVFTRSTLKALQALPFMRAGGPERLGYTPQQMALLCASHNGEPMHVQAVGDMLARAQVEVGQLECGCHVPGMYLYADQPAPPGLVYDERHHNCSGKHAGFAACCRLHGWPVAGYTDPDHPLQQAVRAAVADAVGLPVAELRLGIDGCSAPNYAMPLAHLAWGYARLATGGLGEPGLRLAEAMVTHPDYVSGSSGRNDLALMRAGRGDWVSKVGAEAVQVLASRSRGVALAIKIADGNKPALYAATIELLDRLGWLDDAQRAELEPWRQPTLRNVRGIEVGQRRCVFSLRQHALPELAAV